MNKIIFLLAIFLPFLVQAGSYNTGHGAVDQADYTVIANATKTLSATADQVHFFEPGANADFHILKLADGTDLPNDWWLRVINNSSGFITVRDNGSNNIASVTAGRIGLFQLKSNATSNGIWSYNSPAAVADIVTDHGGLTGLADDDHTQYHNDTRGDARYYQKTEHINAGAGAADAGKPIILNASGVVDNTLLPGGGGLTGFGQLDFGSPSLNGGTVSGSELILQSAKPGYPGLVSDSAQTFTGAKTFADPVVASSTITATGLITGNGGITSANITPSNIPVGAAAFVTASGRLAGDANSFFWDAENRNLNIYGGAGNGTVSGSVNIKAKSDSLGAHLQLEGPGTGGNRYLYLNQRENGDMFFYNPGLNRVLFDYNAAVNAMTIGQSGGEYQFNVKAADSGTTLGTILQGSGLGISNPDTTNGNFSILGFQGSAANRNPDSAIYGVHDLHSGASSSGSLEFHTRNAGTLARAVRVSPTKILTLDGYSTGCLQTDASGVVTASACASGGNSPTSIGTMDSQTKSADGLVTSSTVLYAQTADASFPGLVSTSTQAFAGAKTFRDVVTLGTVTASRPLKSDASKGVTSSQIILSSTDDVIGTLPIGNGGSGLSSTPTNGQLLIGNGSGYSLATITAGSNVTVTNSAGGITINSTATGGGSSSNAFLEGYFSGSSCGFTTSPGGVYTDFTAVAAATCPFTVHMNDGMGSVGPALSAGNYLPGFTVTSSPYSGTAEVCLIGAQQGPTGVQTSWRMVDAAGQVVGGTQNYNSTAIMSTPMCYATTVTASSSFTYVLQAKSASGTVAIGNNGGDYQLWVRMRFLKVQ